MIAYHDLYEILRKEKYSDVLQELPNSFISDFVEYLREKKEESGKSGSIFEDSVSKSKKQYENSVALFKELILKRKKKLLNLVFIAAETGVMKKDYDNMLDFEKKAFDGLVKVFESLDKELNDSLNGVEKEKELESSKMIIFSENVEEFIDLSGNAIGPFSKGELANIEKSVADIFVSNGKANFVDED